jgi:hypothetical protein
MYIEVEQRSNEFAIMLKCERAGTALFVGAYPKKQRADKEAEELANDMGIKVIK